MKLARRMGCDTREAQRRLLSIALFLLGMDHSAETDLMGLAKAAVGEEDAGTVFNYCVNSNAEAWPPAAELTRLERDAQREATEARA